jgi:hypothetical protein
LGALYKWPGQKRQFSRYNSEKRRSKMIFFKLCRIGPLPLGAIVPNLQKNLSTLISNIVILRYLMIFAKNWNNSDLPETL